MFSKYERRIDTRTYGDKKELFNGVSFEEWDFSNLSDILPALAGMLNPFNILIDIYLQFEYIDFWHEVSRQRGF